MLTVSTPSNSDAVETALQAAIDRAEKAEANVLQSLDRAA
jgi:hypothetical protein